MTSTNEAMNKLIRSARTNAGTKAFIERLKKSIERGKEQTHGDKDRGTNG